MRQSAVCTGGFGTPASLSVRQGGRPSCGRGSAVWTGVSSVDGGQQCRWGSAVWTGVSSVDRGQLCGQGLPCRHGSAVWTLDAGRPVDAVLMCSG